MASELKTLVAAFRRGSRKWRGIVGYGFTAVATLITLGALVSILGYLVIHGIGAINWNFFVKEPAAVGEAGGGIAPSLLGTAILRQYLHDCWRAAGRWSRDISVRDGR